MSEKDEELPIHWSEMEITEAVPDPDYLKGNHPCEGCSTIVGDGEYFCLECKEAYVEWERELYEDERDGEQWLP